MARRILCALLAVAAAQPQVPILPIVVAPNGSWPAPSASGDYVGDIRAVLQPSSQPGTPFTAQIFWRRRDNNPELKPLIARDSLGLAVPVSGATIDATCGTVTLSPSVSQTSPYYLYYLPYTQTGGDAWLHFHWLNCTEQNNTACVLGSPVHRGSDSCSSVDPAASAAVVRLETRNAFHGFTPLELLATPAEVAAAFEAAGQPPYLVFPESRDAPLRVLSGVPASWATRTPSTLTAPTFSVAAAVNEWYSFQLGIYAPATAPGLTNVSVAFSDLSCSGGKQIPSAALTCLNSGGTDIDGNAFTQPVSLAAGSSTSLWVGFDVPNDPSITGATCTGTATVSAAGHSTVVGLAFSISSGPALPDRGDSNVTALTRLRWLNSVRGSEDVVPSPYVPVGVEGGGASGTPLTVTALNKRVQLSPDGLPAAITIAAPKIRNGVPVVRSRSILSSAAELRLLDASGASLPLTPTASAPTVTALSNSSVAWTASSTVGSTGATMTVTASMDFDSWVTVAATISLPSGAPSALTLGDVQLLVPYNTSIAAWTAGMDSEGAPWSTATPRAWRWSNTTGDTKHWAGGIDAGLLVSLRDAGDVWTSPMFNQDTPIIPYVPRTWGGEQALGTGNPYGVNVSADGLFLAFSGPRAVQPGGSVTFFFDLSITPARTYNESAHWGKRTFQVGYGTPYYSPQEVAAKGATIVTLHQGIPGIVNGSLVNPYINSPFGDDVVPFLTNYTQQANALGMATKFYYTVRELSNHAAELFAFRALGGEVTIDTDPYAIPQAGYCQDWDCHGGEAYLHNHLGDHYESCWQQTLADGEWDAAVCTHGTSRLFNFYVEGLAWSMAQPPYINGIYYDGISFSRTAMRRARRAAVAAAASRGAAAPILDLHTGHDTPPPVCQYASHYPYMDLVWNGEGFQFNKGPAYWLVEVSNLLHGLSGDRLGGSAPSDDFKGMLFGMTQRNSATAPALWAFWDAAGLAATTQIGWWEEDPVVTLSYTCSQPDPPYHTEILATAYVAYGSHAVIALSSFCPSDESVHLELDWSALGLAPSSARADAPAIAGVQAGFNVVNATGPFAIKSGQGLLLTLRAA